MNHIGGGAFVDIHYKNYSQNKGCSNNDEFHLFYNFTVRPREVYTSNIFMHGLDKEAKSVLIFISRPHLHRGKKTTFNSISPYFVQTRIGLFGVFFLYCRYSGESRNWL
jgi:hypothetical protein